MSIQNLFDPMTGKPKSQAPLVFRTMLITVAMVAVVGSAVANGYFYFKGQQTNAKLEEVHSQLTELQNKLFPATGRPKRPGREITLDDLDSKLSSVEDAISSIESDVSEIERNVKNIESDVSSIQLKIGY